MSALLKASAGAEPLARVSPQCVDRVDMPRVADHARAIAEALVQAALAVLTIRRLTAGEMCGALDVAAVRQLAVTTVASALSGEPAGYGSEAQATLRRYVQSGHDAQGMQMRAVVSELLDGILSGEAYRLAMDPRTVEPASLARALGRMVA